MGDHPCQFGHPEWSPTFDSDPVAGANMRRAVMYGSAMGSFAVEQFSTERLMTLTRAEIDARIRELRQLVAFEEELPA